MIYIQSVRYEALYKGSAEKFAPQIRRKCDANFDVSLVVCYPIDMKKEEALSLALLEGEGYRIEFKEKIANLDREIVAFANGVGGSILLGVRDDGQVIGVSITNGLKSQVMDIARNCDPSIQVNLIVHPKEKVLEVRVNEGADKPYRCKDGFFLRTGPSSQKLKRDEIIAFMNHSGKLHFDESINEHFQYPKDFSQDAFTHFLKTCGITTSLPTEDVLLSLNVCEEKNKEVSLTNAGVLFFAKDPQQFFPESYITAVKYKSQDRLSIIDQKDFTGPILEQIENAMLFLIRHMNVEAKIMPRRGESLVARQDVYDYPLVALREAMVNAVTHRDYYYDHSHIYVHMYPDHIDIENPGGLYKGLTLENLGKRSVRRNRLIADLLHRARYIERVGSGFDRMKHALSDNNNPPLDVNTTNFFDIRFYQRLKDISIDKLTSRQMQAYALFQERDKVTKKEIAIALQISEDTALREINTLIKLNLISKSGSGKATVYRLNKNN